MLFNPGKSQYLPTPKECDKVFALFLSRGPNGLGIVPPSDIACHSFIDVIEELGLLVTSSRGIVELVGQNPMVLRIQTRADGLPRWERFSREH